MATTTTTQPALTKCQKVVLQTLIVGQLSTNNIVNKLGYPWTYDRVHGILARLEKRNIVGRVKVGGISRWFINTQTTRF